MAVEGLGPLLRCRQEKEGAASKHCREPSTAGQPDEGHHHVPLRMNQFIRNTLPGLRAGFRYQLSYSYAEQAPRTRRFSKFVKTYR